MSQVTTIGRELVRDKLPDKFKHFADTPLDKKQITKLMTELALDNPDGYVDMLQKLNNIGQTAVSIYGRDAALSYNDAATSKPIRTVKAQLRQLIAAILDDPELTPEQKEDKIIALGNKYTARIKTAVLDDNNKRKTAMALQINSGSRGNPTQLMQMQFGNMMMVDALDRAIPYVHTDSYAAGTGPMAYWVSASSGRKGYWDVQRATGQSGYLGKQVTATTQATPIEEADCGTTTTGIAFPATDSKNVGAVLLRKWHNYPAGTVVTDKMVKEAEDGEEMIIRSPLTCRSRHGVCQKCSGLSENGKFPAIGDYVSLNSARSFVEAVTQGGLGCLAPDTRVRMGDWSTKAIQDITPGDIVMGVTADMRLEPAKVSEVFYNGIGTMYTWEITYGDSSASITCTEAHRIASTYEHGYDVRRIADIEYPILLDRDTIVQGTICRKDSCVGCMLDIEVANDTHWYLLANGIVTHNSKHKGGVGGSADVDPDGEDQATGFTRLEQFLMAPSTFRGAAVLATRDGKVTNIREAPQGGHYITVADQTVYANPYRTITVKPGDTVSAGDLLTNGMPNPAEIVEYKGLGAGRKYFTTKLNSILDGLDWGTDRRNLESFARAMISKVKITDENGYKDYLPGDIADYNEITADWKPREGSVRKPADKAIGEYLEEPVLNYSIGTRITPDIAKDLKSHDFGEIVVNTKELPFTAQFLRPAAVLQHDSRWLPRMAGERLRDSLFDAARRGMTDTYDSPSYIDKMIISPLKPNKGAHNA